MFDVGWSELLVIAVVAIVVVGPKELPALLRTLGGYVGKMRKTANEFRAHFDEAIREAELESMRTEIESVRKVDPVGSIRRSIETPHEKKISSEAAMSAEATAPAAPAEPTAPLSPTEPPSETPNEAKP